MPGYTIVSTTDVENMFESRGWPGEMRFMSGPLQTEQVAISYRKMPIGSGGKGGYGHRHKTQEELVYVFAGELEVKLDDTVETVKAGQAIRIAPPVVRSFWNAKPEPVELLIISTKSADLREETEMVADFWPAD